MAPVLAGGVLGAAGVLLPDEPAVVPLLGDVLLVAALVEPLVPVPVDALLVEGLELAAVLPADVAALGVLVAVFAVSELPVEVVDEPLAVADSPVLPVSALVALVLVVVSPVVPVGAAVVVLVVAAGVETFLGLLISERLVLIPSGTPGGRPPVGLPPETGGLVDEIGGELTLATGGVVCLGVETWLDGFGVEAVVLALGFFIGACTMVGFGGGAAGFSTAGGVVAFTGGAGGAGFAGGGVGGVAVAVGVSAGFASGVVAVSGGVCSGGFCSAAGVVSGGAPVPMFSVGVTAVLENGVTGGPKSKVFDCPSFCVQV